MRGAIGERQRDEGQGSWLKLRAGGVNSKKIVVKDRGASDDPLHKGEGIRSKASGGGRKTWERKANSVIRNQMVEA